MEHKQSISEILDSLEKLANIISIDEIESAYCMDYLREIAIGLYKRCKRAESGIDCWIEEANRRMEKVDTLKDLLHHIVDSY